MDLQLKGRTAVVTGASQGLGRAIAKGLAAEGVQIAVVARRIELLEQLSDEIEKEGGAKPTVDPATLFTGQPGPTVHFANWPLYIDQAKVNGQVTYPSMAAFTDATGIAVDYEAVIQSNEEFYGKVQPQLAAGDDTGWDIIVITEGRQFELLTLNEWVLPLDHARTPNFNANAATFAKDPAYDPGNRYSMPWQSGLTGIGVNTDLVNGSITKLDDLADPAKVGTNSVGMITSEMPDLVMINLGIDPGPSGPDEWREAAAWLLHQRESGTVRKYYDQGYVDEIGRAHV